MAYTNIKTEIDGKIYTNILREITGDILNEVLKKMVDSLGKGYRYMGILEPDGSRPSGDENMFMVATEAGYYTALANDIPSGITICSFSEGSIQVETILNLDEIFSGNHSWGGNNTFNGYTRFGDEVDVYFEYMYDLEDGETLSGKLASLVTAIATKISKVTGAVEDNLATFDENGNVKDSGVSLADIDEKIDECAKKDGISEKLVSGSARGILSPSAIEELFLFQRTANGAGGTGAAIFQSIKGNSIVWNQLNRDLMQDWSGSMTKSTSDNIVTFRSNASSENAIVRDKLGVGHRVYVSLVYQSNKQVSTQNIPLSLPANEQFEKKSNIYTPSDVGLYLYNYSQLAAGEWVLQIKSFIFIDLTLAFGAGNEPSSVEEFEALYPLISSAYNPGAIKNNAATGMVTDGFNQWDEEWESGRINGVSGQNVADSTAIRSKNYIPVFEGQTYYFKKAASATNFYLFYYMEDDSYITYATPANTTLTIPAGVAKIRFYVDTTSTYKNDICINLSCSRNGEYEPHWSDTTDLPITTATGKLNGEGESVIISPNGLAGVDTIYDEAIVEKGMWTKDIIRRARVDMGTLTWTYYSGSGQMEASVPGMKDVGGQVAICSKYACKSITYWADLTDKSFGLGGGILRVYDTAYTDAATFKAAMSGVILDYPLATEQLYVLDTPVPVVARVDENGTQTILPQGVDESGVPMTAPFKASIQYPVKLGVAPIGQQSLVNLLERMKSAGKIASYTMVWDATTGVYDFTIS